MDPEPDPMAFNVFRVPFFGDKRLIFLPELHGSEAKRLTGLEFTGTQLALKLEIPVLGLIFGPSKAFFFCTYSKILPLKEGGTLPKTAVIPPVDVNLAP
jgi:hypothetical protein